MDQIFREDIVWLDQEFESQESFYREIADRLYKKGLVKETFGQALIDREAVFPTGLKTETFEIAIPHTDVEYVEEVFIAVVRFKTPIPYAHMGEPEIKLNAKFAFVLGIKDPQKQVEVLSTLVKLISDEDTMKALESIQSEKEVSDKMNEFFAENM